jgi:membrane fusion protein (multidrug efflux system)
MRAAPALALFLAAVSPAARAQYATGPTAVGVVTINNRAVANTSQYVGMISAINKVAIVARVSGVLEQQAFTEGSDVKQGDLLYQLERAPYAAALQSKQAEVAQFQAQLRDAKLSLGRATSLLNSPAGEQSIVDTATATKLALQAQMQGAQADADAAAINLGYTEIRSPIDGRIGRTAITPGNVVGSTSGTLTTVVGQDPMYLSFSVPVRVAGTINLAKPPLLSIQLPTGVAYRQTAKLNFTDVSVTANTDTILLRGTIANPAGPGGARPLIDGEFVTVTLEMPGAPSLPAVPRTAILQDQQGSYVFVVDAKNIAHERRITLGATDDTWASVTTGLAPGDQVVTEGIQKLAEGASVKPAPAAASAAQE